MRAAATKQYPIAEENKSPNGCVGMSFDSENNFFAAEFTPMGEKIGVTGITAVTNKGEERHLPEKAIEQDRQQKGPEIDPKATIFSMGSREAATTELLPKTESKDPRQVSMDNARKNLINIAEREKEEQSKGGR